MKKKLLFALSLLSLFVATPSMAREFAEIYTQCGLGAMIAPKHEAVAAVTNVTWDLGTTAISSNISSPDTCQGGEKKAAAFIHDAYEHIEKDLASGKGAYLDTLLVLAGCEPTARPAIASALRSDFAKTVEAREYSSYSRYDNAKGMYDMFNSRINADFAQSCSIG